MGIPRYWWPYLYQYGLGLIIFVIGLIVILRRRSGVLTRRDDRFCFGFPCYAGVHLLWYVAALTVLPNPGEAG